MSDAHFEPLESATEKLLTLKVVLPIVITSLKGVGDLQALSVASCLDPWTGQGDIAPWPDYVPKVPSSPFHPVVLQAFSPPPLDSLEQERLSRLCPVRALFTVRPSLRPVA